MMHLYLYLAAALTIGRIVYLLYFDRLNAFPGPVLARWTNAWRLYKGITSLQRRPYLVKTHQRYGDVVRIGPNALSFAHPQALKDIYGTDKPFDKYESYATVAAVDRGRPAPSLFSSIDTQWHDNLRRAIQPAFNLSALIQYEPFVNDTVATFIRQLDTRFADRIGAEGDFDLAYWLHWYAFDVVGELTYGSAFGFLESGADIDHIIHHTHRFLMYSYVVGQMPWLDKVFYKNPVLLWLNRRGLFNRRPNPIVTWALKRQVTRDEVREQSKQITSSRNEERVDLIDKFLQAKDDHPDTISDKSILGLGVSMVLAGYESTAITLSAIFYYVLKNSDTYTRLKEELDHAFPELELGQPAPFQTAAKLPYLDACVKEAFRMHPASRISPERVLPPGGATIAGHSVPGGSIVGVNAWVLHRRQEIFGYDVESYKPERWLHMLGEDENKANARISEMNRTLFQFGAGKFNCIGQHISRLEMYKAVASLLMAFDFELVRPDEEWRFEGGGFVTVRGVDVRIKRRHRTTQKK